MSATDKPDGCSLTEEQQTRNMLIYAVNWALVYLAMPVTYVGVVQATLLDKLGFGGTNANLPAGVYLWTTPLAVVVVWLFPQSRQLKYLLIGAFGSAAVMSTVTTLAIRAANPTVILAALVAQAGAWGCANGVVASCQWEMIGRGVSHKKRGQALALAFGLGPILAMLASLGSQLAMTGKIEGIDLPFTIPTLDFPGNFALIFSASIPVLILAALLSSYYLVPSAEKRTPNPDNHTGIMEKRWVPEVDVPRKSLREEIFGGAGAYFGHPLIRAAALAYVLVYSGHMIFNNISLYTEVVLGKKPEHYAGLLLMQRFGFKIVAGLFLGWLLIRTNPRTLLLVTALMTLSSIAWATWVPGMLYLISFGILGAGELFGVYYPNYILGCSTPAQMRRHMALTGLITMAVGFAPVFFGYLSERFGAEDKQFGFQVSFAAAATLVVLAILLVVWKLPAQPRPGHGPNDVACEEK